MFALVGDVKVIGDGEKILYSFLRFFQKRLAKTETLLYNNNS